MKIIFKRVLLCFTVLFSLCLTLQVGAKNGYVDDKVHEYQKAIVTDVVDGDTIKVKIDGRKYKLRLILIDTPELSDSNKEIADLGKKASRFTKKMLKGKNVYLEKDVSDTDKYDRLLRYVWLKEPKHPLEEKELYQYCFNSVLLEKGYAQLSTHPPDVAYADYFKTRVKLARKKKVGLYAEKKSGTPKKKNDTSNRKIQQLTEEVKIGRNTYIADVTQGVIKGNKKSKIYHMEGQTGYNKISVKNVIFFESEEEAIAKGYRRAKR